MAGVHKAAREALRTLLMIFACFFLAAAMLFLVVLLIEFFSLDKTGAATLHLAYFVGGIAVGAAVIYLVHRRIRASQQQAEQQISEALEELRAATREMTATGQQLSEQAGITPTVEDPDVPELPATSEPELSPAPSRFSSLDLDEFSQRIIGIDDPLSELRLIEVGIVTREQSWAGRGTWEGGRAQARRERLAAKATGEMPPAPPVGPDPDPETCPIPSGLELFLAHRLRDSGLFDSGLDFPRVRIVKPHSSGMFYLRVEQPQVEYATMLAILRIEAALNAVRFCSLYHDDPQALSERDCVCFMQRLTSSVVAQADPIDAPPERGEDEPADADPEGEWAVRHAISQAIESVQLPYRLSASFRTNVADGNVAFEVNLTPGEVFPRQYYPADFPTAKPLEATRTTRRQLASGYALRLAVLLAAVAFRTTPKIKHVWVAGIHESATRHDCYFSIDFDRWRFARLDLEDLGDLERTLHPFCPVMRLEDGFLRPVQQTFALSEERFCPRRRYESVSLSIRQLPSPLAKALGTDHVSGLAIGESDKREAVANDILRRWADPAGEHATERNVRTILEIAGDDPDPTVRSAAERTVVALTQGTLPDDPFSVAEEFVAGDELSRACRAAVEALQARDPKRALEILGEVLSPIRTAGTYVDSATVEWRYFDDFVDRALYNRLREHPERSLMLVPEGYFEAQALAVTCLLMCSRNERAVEHARELVRIAPFDTRSHLQLVRALENSGDNEGAIAQLCTLLRVAHDPQSVGTAYYRMAFFQWQEGELLLARACYTAALRFIPMAAPQVAMELATLALQTPGDTSDLERELTRPEVVEILREHDIPEAPADEISDAFVECARASVDAEIFPVARNFLSTMAAFSPDDVIVGLMRSLEDAPDSL